MHEYHSALDCSYSCMQVKRFGIKVSNISEMTLTLQKLSLVKYTSAMPDCFET